ncbi:glycosyltransferase family 2 protein [Marinobacter vinifirmus]|nr:glycosyltransferase family 2 protein [Marinobacter vinifirmus]
MQGLTPLTTNGDTQWACHTDDPQFYINVPDGEVYSKPGWLTVEYDFLCDEPTVHQVYLNRGKGYEADLVVTRYVEGSGKVQISFRSSGGLIGLRLDPAMHQVQFEIGRVVVRWSDELPEGANDDAPWLGGFFDLEAGRYGCFFKPVNDLERFVTNGFHWLSVGGDPYFRVVQDGKDLALAPGWYLCSVHVAYERDRQLARFYFDPGTGFSEKHAIALILDSGTVAERLVYLPEGARAVRFDPQERKGLLRVDGVSFSPVDPTQAFRSCIERISEVVDEFASLERETLLRELEQRAKDSETSLDSIVHGIYQESFVQPPGALEYDDWIQEVELPSLPSPEQTGEMLERMAELPIISVLVPVYNTDERLLRECLDSVLSQSYPHWELCVADDASPAAHVREVLEEYQAVDGRIKVVFREENGHISAASNSALALAQGDYVALLDHDDLLSEHALLFAANALSEQPDAAIIYSDEDKVDAAGRRYDPHFKSEWNPDLFFSQNYVSHLGIYRRDLLEKIGGFRKGFEGSQDQDLLLRCLPFVDDSQIVHIPRVLYHWRAIEGSTARSSEQKDYTTEAGLKALKDYFEANGPSGVEVEQGFVSNTYHVKWPIPSPEPLVSLLIPTRDRRDLVEVAVRSILDKSDYQNFEILILDNGSQEPETLAFFEQIQAEDERVRVLRYDYPFNYSAINNFGAREAKGSIIGLINNDVEVISPEWLTEMVRHVSRKNVGCVGAKLYYSNDTVQHAGVILGLGGVAGHSHKHFDREHPGYFHRLVLTQNLSAVTAACLLVRRDVYDEVGGLDEENLKVAFNDVDFCLKVAAAGYRNLWTPYAELYHYESVSRGKEDSPEKIRRFQQEIEYMRERWGDVLDADPGYSQNLTRDREDFSIGTR